MCADACGAARLEVPELSRATRKKLAEFAPGIASRGNPVDMIASAGPTVYEQAIKVMAGSGEVDALVVIFIPPLRAEPAETAVAIRRAAPSRSMPFPRTPFEP
jgi:acetate---CoA ligase (ADP-forming)